MLANGAACAGDVTDPEFPQLLVNATLERFGSIDIIVNNAGYTWDNVIQKTTDEQFQAMLDIHLVRRSAFCARLRTGFARRRSAKTPRAARVMRKVVNITSIAGTDGSAGQAGYSSGKAGVMGLTKTLAKEWGRYNVNVNAVGFGLIETRLMQPLGGEDRRSTCKGARSRSACSLRCWSGLRRRVRWAALVRLRRPPARCCSSARRYRIMLLARC